MADSLILAGYELLGQATAFSLAQGTFDLGVAQPDQAGISSLLLDGDVESGDRTANRTVNLTLLVRATSRADMTAQMDTMARAVNVRSGTTFTLQWTPTGGLPLIFDCQRATVQRQRSIVRDNQLVGYMAVSFQASPFGRSPDQQTIAIAGQQQLVTFDSAQTGGTLDTTNKYEGTGSNRATLTKQAFGPSLSRLALTTPISGTFASKDLTADNAVTLQVRWVAPALDGGVAHTWLLGASLTLTSSGGSITIANAASLSYASGTTGWQMFTFSLLDTAAITATTGTFDISAVTGYSLTFNSSNARTTAMTSISTSNFNVDDLRALPAASAQVATSRGSLLTVPAIVGSARTPVSLAAIGTINALLAHHPPIDQDATAQILTGVTVAASPSHPAATTIATANANFNGTYSAVLGVATLGAAGVNTATVTITQLENGASVASQVLTATYTSPQADRLVKLGDVTLPLRRVPADNTTTTYTIDVNHTAGADAYSDFMLLDTRGQTVIADPPSAVGAVYLDAPTSLLELGAVYASAGGNRTDAYCIDDTTFATGGPFLFDPGNDRMLIWSDTAVPTLTTTYYPRWLDERVT